MIPTFTPPHPRTGWVSSEVLRWYREDGGILPLTAENIRGLSMDDREEVARVLFHHFRVEGFPYPTFSDVERRKDWLALKDVPEVTWVGNTVGSANLAGSKLFKHYFPHFFECSEPGPRGTVKPSLVQQFADDEMLMKVLRNRLGITFVYKGEHFPFTMTGNMLRQGFRSMRLAPPTTNFKSSVAKAIYQRYLPPGGITYDYSVGFGQRMLGFLASGKGGVYVGVDPWSKQIDASQKLLDFLGGGPVRLIRDVSERFCPDDLHGQVDLAFSSPPYFTTEVYEAPLKASYEVWLMTYWLPTVRNIMMMLRPGGRLVLNVAETSARHPLREDMVAGCIKAGFVVEETLGMLMPTSHMSGKATTGKTMKTEPILVFRKTG